MDEAMELLRLRDAVLYLLRENRRDRESYPMDTAEVDAHLEGLTG